MSSGNITALPTYSGYIGASVAVLFFGSNFVPVKKYETGDGLFFQFMFCIAVWTTSVVLNAIRGFPRFWPLAMFGGALWCTGNVLVVPIIQCLGLAMGLLIWAVTNMLVGWASGSFGWFGTTAEPAKDMVMNCIGVGLCVLGAVAVSLIKPHLVEPDDHTSKKKPVNSDTDPLLPSFDDLYQSLPDPISSSQKDEGGVYGAVQSSDSKNGDKGDVHSLVHKLSPAKRKIVGIILCVIAGTLFGLNFTPIIYIKDNYGNNGSDYKLCTQEPCISDVSPKDLDYVFSQFTGILLTSTFYFVVYCALMKNRPRVYPKTILPAMISGLMWGLGDIGWFIANEVLDPSGPSVIASLWGLIAFKEIQGKRNITMLFISFVLIIGGCILTGISKT